MDSAALLLDHSDALQIGSNIGETNNPISSTSTFEQKFYCSHLVGCRDFVVQQVQQNRMNSNTFLWQSVDYPTESLLPGMKLGVNHKTGHNLSLVSWFTRSIAASGLVRHDWEPISRELVIKHTEQVYLTSGQLKNNKFEHTIRDRRERC